VAAHSEIGAARVRVEDRRLVTGRGQYTSDFAPDGLCHAVLVRSPHAHARIRAIDAAAALAVPGVAAVLTGADVATDGLLPIPHEPGWLEPPDVKLTIPADFTVFVTEHAILPRDTVRFVGEAVALVVAETLAAAQDGAEAVEVDYEPLPALLEPREALAPGAPLLWPGCAGNLALTCEVGDRAATDRAFANAAHVVRLESRVNRVTGVPMEPRAAIGEYDSATGRYTLRAGSGRGVVQTRERLARILGVPKERCRVVFGDMGGNFGTRNAFAVELALMPWAARRVGRPVKWVGDRRECFLSDYQARDLGTVSELALDAEGNFLGLRGVNISNLGAYTVYFSPLRKGLTMMQGGYRIPAVHFVGHSVLTNTVPTAVYRSTGRPESIYVIERLIDLAAAAGGFDRVELRRRNLITPDAMPFTTPVDITYDSGDYPAAMDAVLRAADWDGFAARKAESARRGRCRGRSIVNYIETTSGIPRERAELRVCDDGFVELVVGTMSSGQGHETSFPQLVADWLQVPFETIRFVANDTDRVTVGGGSHSGRSMRLVSIAVTEAIADLVAKGKAVAARQLQAPVEDIAYADGVFRAAGGGEIGLWAAAKATDLLEGVGDITVRSGAYPYGAHVCEVEVDPETGHVAIVAWTGVDDVGLAVNPLILHGQAHGAVVQGIGQALSEAIRYEAGTAQMLTGSFMDYAMPRADAMPPITAILTEVPASSHPHGIRPGGEGGTTPSLAAVINAITDALSEYGVAHVEMPATPQRVWQAIRDARKG
jgi:carbon-monoxide dehydrogenase large subunit